MNVEKLIMEKIIKKKEVKASEIIRITGFSREYINQFFRKLRESGEILLIGKANNARYILATEKSVNGVKEKIKKVYRIVKNKDLYEDVVLKNIKSTTGILLGVPENISDIFDYTFSEMLNNAIEHSRADEIEIFAKREQSMISFKVVDRGIGIFENIKKKKQLRNKMEAIQDLLKGKETTIPEAHSGEGIFFTSKLASIFIVSSDNKRVIFDNVINDIFIKDIKKTVGTNVAFSVDLKSKKTVENVFKKFTDNAYEFNKTEVVIKLYKENNEYVSRSQARRVLSGLNKFGVIVLDFKDVRVVGQGFADEVFRVWQNKHSDIKILTKNTDENIDFMIKRVSG